MTQSNILHGMQAQWLNHIQVFKFHLHYKASPLNVMANALSRRAHRAEDSASTLTANAYSFDLLEEPILLLAAEIALHMDDTLMSEMAALQIADKFCAPIIATI